MDTKQWKKMWRQKEYSEDSTSEFLSKPCVGAPAVVLHIQVSLTKVCPILYVLIIFLIGK